MSQIDDDLSVRAEWWIAGDLSHPEFSWGPLQTSPDRCLPIEIDRLRQRTQRLTAAVRDTPIGPRRGLVLWTERPSIVDQSMIDALASDFPLARLILIVGSWCEGEMRTGRPVTGVERWRWTDWRQLTLGEFDSSVAAESHWRPRTWTPIERWLESCPARAADSVLRPEVDGESETEILPVDQDAIARSNVAIVAIEAHDRWAYEPLADVVLEAGLMPMWVRDRLASGPGAAWVEGDNLVGWIRDESGLAPNDGDDALLPLPAPRCLIVRGFPRENEVRLRSEHAAALLTKPYAIEPLRRWLRELRWISSE